MDDDEGPPPLIPDDPPSAAPGGMGGLADMMRGMGGGAGGAGAGGGMPDLSSIMNNPQMMAMAQQMAQNGGLASLMQNPAVANMVCVSLFFSARKTKSTFQCQMSQMQSGGGMPSMDQLMSDPTLADL